MTEDHRTHHGLEAFLQGMPERDGQASEVRVDLISPCGHFNLRGNPNKDGFRQSIEAALERSLPGVNTFVEAHGFQVYWMGPDEWLIVTPGASNDRHTSLDNLPGTLLNDLSGGQLLLEISGTGAEQLLSKGCPLDLSESAFPMGACAQSSLAKANVLIARAHSEGVFRIIVRRSFADYLARWLAHAGSASGIDFRTRHHG